MCLSLWNSTTCLQQNRNISYTVNYCCRNLERVVRDVAELRPFSEPGTATFPPDFQPDTWRQIWIMRRCISGLLRISHSLPPLTALPHINAKPSHGDPFLPISDLPPSPRDAPSVSHRLHPRFPRDRCEGCRRVNSSAPYSLGRISPWKMTNHCPGSRRSEITCLSQWRQ